MRDTGQPRKAFVETDARGRIHVAVEKVRFYAATLGSVAVAVGVVMGVAGYMLQPYLAKVARSAVSAQLADYVTKEKLRDHQQGEESRIDLIAGQMNETARILDSVERRLEIHSRRIDRLYEHQWRSQSGASLPSTALAPWPPPGDLLRPPGWYIRGVPR